MQTEGSTCLKDCIKPSMFPVVVKAVKVTAGYDEKMHKFSVPSLALKLTHLEGGAETASTGKCKYGKIECGITVRLLEIRLK